MKLQKKVTMGVGYANKLDYQYEGKDYEADIKSGDIVTIKSDIATSQGQYGEKKTLTIETRNGDKAIDVNQTTINCFIDEWGANEELESEALVGKRVKVFITKETINGKKCMPAFLAPSGWELDEWGVLEKVVQTETAPKDPVEQPPYPESDEYPDAF